MVISTSEDALFEILSRGFHRISIYWNGERAKLRSIVRYFVEKTIGHETSDIKWLMFFQPCFHRMISFLPCDYCEWKKKWDSQPSNINQQPKIIPTLRILIDFKPRVTLIEDILLCDKFKPIPFTAMVYINNVQNGKRS